MVFLLGLCAVQICITYYGTVVDWKGGAVPCSSKWYVRASQMHCVVLVVNVVAFALTVVNGLGDMGDDWINRVGEWYVHRLVVGEGYRSRLSPSL